MITCVKPLIRAETYERYINKKGGISYKVEWLDRTYYDECMKNQKSKDWLNMKYRRVSAVPCGRCTECKLNYSRNWAVDCMLEKTYYKDNEVWFLTLTYEDEYLPFYEFKSDDGQIFKGISLRKKDLQDFWKRLRKHYPKAKIKYLAVGEYGKTTSRPHYHAIIFGVPLDYTKFKWVSTNENCDNLWQSEELNTIWRKGNVIIGEVTYKSVAYVARYTLKKQKDKDIALDQRSGRIPPFIVMSQGIGKRYYQEHQNEMIEYSNITINGMQVPLPKRFMRYLKDINEDVHTTLSARRKYYAEQNQIQKDAQTDLSREKQRQKEEYLLNSKFKDIRR